ALAVYADARRLLVEELGVEPGSELQRVHHAILTNADEVPRVRDQDRHDPVVPRQLPPTTRRSVGRAAGLRTLSGLVAGAASDTDLATVIAVIDGTVGVGKTTLALHWAHRMADQFPDGQLYVDLRGFDPGGPAVPPGEAIRGFLDVLGVPPQRIPAGVPA